MNKTKKYFESAVSQNFSLIVEAIQYNLPTSLPKSISRNLYLEKVCENKTKGKFKFSMPHIYLQHKEVIKEP